MKQDDNGILIGVGPEFEKLPNWQKANEELNNRIMALGEIPHDKLFDYIKNSEAYCENTDKMPEKIIELLYDSKKVKENINSVMTSLSELNNTEVWQNNLKKLIEVTPKEHKINNFKEKIGEISDLDLYHYFINIDREKKKTFLQKILTIDKKFNFRVITFLGKEFIFPI